MIEQNLTHPKDNFWSHLTCPCQIAIVWDDQTTANMDPWCITQYMGKHGTEFRAMQGKHIQISPKLFEEPEV